MEIQRWVFSLSTYTMTILNFLVNLPHITATFSVPGQVGRWSTAHAAKRTEDG